MAGSANSIQAHNVLRGRLSEDNVIAGTVGTGYNPTYALVGEAAAQIVLYINSSDYKMYAELKDKNGNHIMNSNIIDLPLETMVVNGSYDSETREVVLILDNGNEIRFSVADLVRGLVSEEGLATILGDYVKFTDYATDNASGVLKTNFSNSFSVNPSNGVPYCDGKTYEQYGSAGNGMFIGKQTLENVITGKQLVNKTYVDEADEVFEEDLFGDASIIDSGESIILNNTIEKAPLSITLKGNTYQNSTSGKNLFDKDNPIIINGYIRDNSPVVVINSNNANRLAVIQCKTNTTYTIQKNGGDRFSVFTYNSLLNTNGEYTVTNFIRGTTDGSPEPASQTISTGSDTYLYIHLFENINNVNLQEILSTIQIEQGSSATPYEEYTGGIASPNPDYPQDINVVTGNNVVNVCGKNLIPITNQDFTVNNVRYYANEGNLIVNGTSTSETSSKNTNFKNNFNFTLPSGTYNIKVANGITTSKFELFLYGYDNDNVLVNLKTNNISSSFTLNSTTKLYFGFYVYQATFNNVNIEIQVEKGTTATTYEAYKGQNYPIILGSLEMCKIENYEDYFYKDNGNWYLHKKIGKIVLDGTGYWGTASEGDTTNGFSIYSTTIDNILNDTFKVLYCDMFKYISRNNLTSSSINFVYSGSNNVVVLNIDRILLAEETTTGFKNWLSTNQPLLYYPLATPTDTQITDTTLVNQLNALYNATSYDTQTNINQVNANLPFILDISTFKNTTKGKIEALEQEDENYEKLSNKVIELSSSSTDTEYPSAKCVYNLIGNIESILETLDIGNGV